MPGTPLTTLPRDAVMAEMDWLSSEDLFARSPKMLGLLRYLVDQTLAGNGPQLKSYTVAVEGLGRDERFDPQTDSYPRVQTGRLRRQLELLYSRPDNITRPLRLRMASVGYEVVADMRDPNGSGAEPTGAALGSGDIAGAPPWKNGKVLAGVASLVIVVAAAVVFWLSASTGRMANLGATAPILELRVSGGHNDAERRAMRGWLQSSLAPSWLFRLSDPEDAAIQTSGDSQRYRLSVNIVPEGDYSRYQFSLTDTASSALVWSATRTASDPVSTERSELDPLITALSSPYGVIASQERVRLGTRAMGSYACLLRAELYFASPNTQDRGQVLTCLNEGLRRDPDDHRLLTANAVMTYNRNDPASDLSAAGLARSYDMIRTAAELAPSNPDVAIIQSRYYFLGGDCARGRMRSADALQRWPHAARYWGLAGFYLFECNDPAATEYVENALRLEGRNVSLYESVLVFDALDRNDLDEANAAADRMNLADRRTDLFRDLTLAVLAAANGNTREADLRWTNFARAVRVDPKNRAAVYAAYKLGSRQSRIAERYLSAAGVGGRLS